MRSEALISVIMPAYNMGKYIRGALSSILEQTYQNLEILVIDDCSSDDTVKICEELAEADEAKRVRVIRMPENGGVSRARNRGLELVSGEYIFFMDSDDLLVKDAVERLERVVRLTGAELGYIPHFRSSSEEILWEHYLAGNSDRKSDGKNDEKGEERPGSDKMKERYTDLFLMVEGENVMKAGYEKVFWLDKVPYKLLDRDGCPIKDVEKIDRKHLNHWMGSNSIFEDTAMGGKLVRTDLVKKNGLAFDEQLVQGEDTLIVWHFYYHSSKVVMMMDPCYYYLLREGSLTRPEKIPPFASGSIAAMKKVQDLYEKHGYTEYADAMENPILADERKAYVKIRRMAPGSEAERDMRRGLETEYQVPAFKRMKGMIPGSKKIKHWMFIHFPELFARLRGW